MLDFSYIDLENIKLKILKIYVGGTCIFGPQSALYPKMSIPALLRPHFSIAESFSTPNEKMGILQNTRAQYVKI